jgi:ABC-2 type transport system permease protein
MDAWRRAGAFWLRDATQHLSYRTAAILDVVSIAVVVLMHYFLARLVDATGPALPGGYFPFVLTGIAFSSLLTTAVRSFAESIRQAQLTGVLEALFVAPVANWEIVVYGSLWTFSYQALRVLVFLLAGALLGLPLGQVNWPGLPLLLVLSICALAPFGILGAACVLVWQKGDPIAYFVGVVSMIFAGVYYPISVLPRGLQLFSAVFPLTHALDGFRGLVVEGASLWSIRGSLAALAVSAALLGPLSLWAFARAVDWCKRQGALHRS